MPTAEIKKLFTFRRQTRIMMPLESTNLQMKFNDINNNKVTYLSCKKRLSDKNDYVALNIKGRTCHLYKYQFRSHYTGAL